jgi:hypothetical protein
MMYITIHWNTFPKAYMNIQKPHINDQPYKYYKSSQVSNVRNIGQESHGRLEHSSTICLLENSKDPNKIILLTPRLLHLHYIYKDRQPNIKIISTWQSKCRERHQGKMHAQNKRGKGNYGVHPHNAMCIVYMWPNKQDKRCMHWAGGVEGGARRLHRYMHKKIQKKKKTWFQPKLHTCYVDELVAIR